MLQYLEKIKLKIKKVLLAMCGIKLQVKTPTRYFGNEYGGYAVAPNTLQERSIVYSFGVGEDISFDLDIMQQCNAEVYAFDPTPKSIKWVRKQDLPSNFHFFTYGLSNKNGSEKFYLPKNTNYVSGSVLPSDRLKSEYIEVEMYRLSTIMKNLQHDKVDILKMDIEGSEYMVIPDILSYALDISQICLEVHGRFYKNGIAKTRRLVKLLNQHEYYIIYISDSFEELTFLKRNNEINAKELE